MARSPSLRDEVSFWQTSADSYFRLSIVPSVLVTLQTDDFNSKVKQLAKLYECDLPYCIESKLRSWHIKWQKHLKEHGEASPPNPTLTIKQISSIFPNIGTLVRLLCILPVTTCSEWIKTPFRSEMSTTHLSGLTLLHVHFWFSLVLQLPSPVTLQHQRKPEGGYCALHQWQ